jgi:fructose-bisphosphate aldolase class 1
MKHYSKRRGESSIEELKEKNRVLELHKLRSKIFVLETENTFNQILYQITELAELAKMNNQKADLEIVEPEDKIRVLELHKARTDNCILGTEEVLTIKLVKLNKQKAELGITEHLHLNDLLYK